MTPINFSNNLETQDKPTLDMKRNLEHFTAFLQNFENPMSLDLLCLSDTRFSKAKQFARQLRSKVDKILKPSAKSEGEQVRLKVIVFEREMDLSTPAYLDLHFESLLVDQLKVDINKEMIKNNVKVKFDDNSALYPKYRYMFLSEIFQNFDSEFDNFRKKYKNITNRDRNNENMGNAQMNKVVRNVVSHNRDFQDLTTHQEKIKDINNWMSDFFIIGTNFLYISSVKRT